MKKLKNYESPACHEEIMGTKEVICLSPIGGGIPDYPVDDYEPIWE